MKKGEKSIYWSPEDHARMMTMAEAEFSWAEIGEALDRSPCACQTRYRDYKDGGGFRRTERQNKVVIAAARRAAEVAIPHASLTAAFFGDPLPGRSALDRRQAEGGIRSISLAGGVR